MAEMGVILHGLGTSNERDAYGLYFIASPQNKYSPTPSPKHKIVSDEEHTS